MRNVVFLAAILLAVSTSAAFAGKIFGDIRFAGKPVPEGVLVTLQPVVKSEGKDKPAPAPAPIDSTTTDKVGSYKFMAKDEGKCTLTVLYEKESASLEVFSYKEAARYDLILEKKDGKLAIRRK
jgi:hypothetical protein